MGSIRLQKRSFCVSKLRSVPVVSVSYDARQSSQGGNTGSDSVDDVNQINNL